MRFKVVITDTIFGNYDIEQRLIAASGLDIESVYLRTHDAAEIVRHAATAHAVVLAESSLPRQVITQLTRCWVIVRYGIGVDTVDLQAATEHGIVVCNTARYCLDEVSTHVLTLLLLLDRGILADTLRIRSGGWSGASAPPRRLAGQQLGLVGLGNIGRTVARKALGVGLRVVAHDPYVQQLPRDVQGVPLTGLDELLSTSDYVSLHVPLNTTTRHLIGERELRLMKPSAFLINTSRGAVVDQPALTDALASGRLAGAGLDVFEHEPLAPDDPLRQLDSVILTPHAAHWSVEASVECRETAIDHVLAVLRGKRPTDIVNPEVLQSRRWRGAAATAGS
ncbi:MAG: C-terminal binding protein [Chloroflexi bacterium]|nr:C-terminal binding protein [Chloroflexota bacterium]